MLKRRKIYSTKQTERQIYIYIYKIYSTLRIDTDLIFNSLLDFMGFYICKIEKIYNMLPHMFLNIFPIYKKYVMYFILHHMTCHIAVFIPDVAT